MNCVILSSNIRLHLSIDFYHDSRENTHVSRSRHMTQVKKLMRSCGKTSCVIMKNKKTIFSHVIPLLLHGLCRSDFIMFKGYMYCWYRMTWHPRTFSMLSPHWICLRVTFRWDQNHVTSRSQSDKRSQETALQSQTLLRTCSVQRLLPSILDALDASYPAATFRSLHLRTKLLIRNCRLSSTCPFSVGLYITTQPYTFDLTDFTKPEKCAPSADV